MGRGGKKVRFPGLTPRAVLEKLAAMQMIDVELPTTDDRVVVLSRYTEPEKNLLLQLARLHRRAELIEQSRGEPRRLGRLLFGMARDRKTTAPSCACSSQLVELYELLQFDVGMQKCAANGKSQALGNLLQLIIYAAILR
jgi:hypothetical protein